MKPLAGNRLFAIAAWIGAVVLGFVAGGYIARPCSGSAFAGPGFVTALAALVCWIGLAHVLAVMRTVTRLLDLRDTLERIVNRTQKDGGASR